MEVTVELRDHTGRHLATGAEVKLNQYMVLAKVGEMFSGQVGFLGTWEGAELCALAAFRRLPEFYRMQIIERLSEEVGYRVPVLMPPRNP